MGKPFLTTHYCNRPLVESTSSFLGARDTEDRAIRFSSAALSKQENRMWDSPDLLLRNESHNRSQASPKYFDAVADVLFFAVDRSTPQQRKGRVRF